MSYILNKVTSLRDVSVQGRRRFFKEDIDMASFLSVTGVIVSFRIVSGIYIASQFYPNYSFSKQSSW